MEETTYLLHLARYWLCFRLPGDESFYTTQSRTTASRRALTVARAIPNLRLQKSCELVIARYLRSHEVYIVTHFVSAHLWSYALGRRRVCSINTERIANSLARISIVGMRRFSIQQSLIHAIRQKSILPKGRILNLPASSLSSSSICHIKSLWRWRSLYFVTCPPKGHSATRHFFASALQRYSGKQ